MTKREREELQLIVNSMGDVVSLGRFAAVVDPVRLVQAWQDDLIRIMEEKK